MQLNLQIRVFVKFEKKGQKIVLYFVPTCIFQVFIFYFFFCSPKQAHVFVLYLVPAYNLQENYRALLQVWPKCAMFYPNKVNTVVLYLVPACNLQEKCCALLQVWPNCAAVLYLVPLFYIWYQRVGTKYRVVLVQYASPAPPHQGNRSIFGTGL